MKKIMLISVQFLLYLQLVAQQKEFEGTLVYRQDIKSKIEQMSDRALKNLVAFGNEVTIQTKNGNYRHTMPKCDFYYISNKEKVFIKYKDIDTLFYLDYNSDSAILKKVSRSNETRTIAGQECKQITVETDQYTVKYFYAPALYLNPEHDKNNKLVRYDVFVKETSSVYLDYTEESKFYTITATCSKIQPGEVNDSVFNLPKLPVVKFSYDLITKPAEFTRAGGWQKYLQTNLNADLGAKYIKMSKDETTATQTVKVRFLINEFGAVSNISVVNKDEVHKKLADEAVRVVSESPVWKPATVLGEKTIYWMVQPVTFTVVKN